MIGALSTGIIGLLVIGNNFYPQGLATGKSNLSWQSEDRQSGQLLIAQGSDSMDLEVPGQVKNWSKRAVDAYRMGDPAKSLRLQLEVINWLRSNPQKAVRYRPKALSNLSVYLRASGRVKESLAPAIEATALARLLSRKDKGFLQDLAGYLNNLGGTYVALGMTQNALAPTLEALAIRRRLAIADEASLRYVADSLANLAGLYTELGRLQEALASAEDAVGAGRDIAKSDPSYLPDLAGSLHGLGAVYGYLGRTREALESTRESAMIYRSFVKKNPAYLDGLEGALGNLATYYGELAQYEQALALAKESLAIRRRLAGSNPGFLGKLGRSLEVLGDIYSDLGRVREGLESKKEALAMYRMLVQSSERYRIDLARLLNNLGSDFVLLGRDREALAHTEESLAIYRRLGSQNFLFVRGLSASLFNLAGIRSRLMPSSEISSILAEMIKTEVISFQRQLPLLSEQRRQALVNTFGLRWQMPFALASRHSVAVPTALITRLNRHGLLLDVQKNQALLAQSKALQPLREQMQALGIRLGNPELPANEQQQQLLQKHEQLEQQLYRQLPALQPQLIQVDQVRQFLPINSALVEFQRYWDYDPTRPRDQRVGAEKYIALALKPDGQAQAIPLGEAAPIDAAIARASAATAANNADALDLWQQVGKLVLKPLQQNLSGVRVLFVSPDGELNRVPFAALPAPGTSQHLAERFQLRLLTSGRDLLQLQKPAKAGSSPVVIADPSFGASTGAGANSQLRRGQPWQPLPGTRMEAQQVAALLQAGKPITGPDATADRALQQRGPLVFHIATHGRFAEAQAQKPELDGTNPNAGPAWDDAMQRSALVLAGANSAGGNGYLTAAQITTMDLQGTELVTLSACETGLGEARTGEGVYGLQRALTVAGARSTLLSLWKVDDAATTAFMTAFYQRLRKGEGRADALAATQAEFRRHANPAYREPYVWAAFQLTGDWRPIPGLARKSK